MTPESYVKKSKVAIAKNYIAQIATAHKENKLSELFTAKELSLYAKRPRSLAARWILKECIWEYLAPETGDQEKNFCEIEILSTSLGKPLLQLSGNM